MLTWAIAWFSVRAEGHNGLWFIAAIVGDVYLAYYVACAVTGHAPK